MSVCPGEISGRDLDETTDVEVRLSLQGYVHPASDPFAQQVKWIYNCCCILSGQVDVLEV